MIYLVDASVYVFRAYYSVPDAMTDASGRPTNAVYGFTRFLIELLEETAPSHIAVAFDESLSTSFRNDIYPAYKANREPAPEDLQRQIAWCQQAAQSLGLVTLADGRYEADDLIGTVARLARAADVPCTVVTRDKDLAQLLTPGDIFYDFAGGTRYGHSDVREKFGTTPERIADFLSLTGDSVDNIPGVPGIGKKTASAIFDVYASLDDVYADLDGVATLSVRGARTLPAKLQAHRDAAYLAQRLTRIACDAPVPAEIDHYARQAPDFGGLETLFDELGIGRALRDRVAALPAC
ncbi:MAG: 5'-3' exonuclease H3TH domain-containing protein [Pseudomonadota bacterium]